MRGVEARLSPNIYISKASTRRSKKPTTEPMLTTSMLVTPVLLLAGAAAVTVDLAILIVLGNAEPKGPPPWD